LALQDNKQSQKLGGESPSPTVVGKKVANNSKGLSAKKVSSDFFADFEIDDEEEEEEAPKEPESRYIYKYLMYLVSCRYAPSKSLEEDEKKNNNNNIKEKENKPTVGSDAFVPIRSKEAIRKEQKERESQSGSHGVAQQNFSKAKAISSKQFFGEEESVDRGEKDRRLNKFEGARSISSADYFDRDEKGMSDNGMDASDIARKIANTAKADVSHVKDVITDSGRKVNRQKFRIKINNFIRFLSGQAIFSPR
jgi:hypothetical protein